MNTENYQADENVEELPDQWWHRVYLSVIVTIIIVLALLWAFSRYFS